MRQIPTIYFSKTKMHGEDVESVFVQLKKKSKTKTLQSGFTNVPPFPSKRCRKNKQKESYLCGFLLVLKDTCKTFSPRRYPLRLAMAMAASS